MAGTNVKMSDLWFFMNHFLIGVVVYFSTTVPVKTTSYVGKNNGVLRDVGSCTI